MRNKRVLPALLGSVALTLGLVTVTTSINKEVVNAAEVTATLSFANAAQRTEIDGDHQVWKQNGITVTNNQGSSTSAVADYVNPVRFYKSSDLIVEFTKNINSIVFDCNSNDYATVLKNSIGDTAIVSNDIVTVKGINSNSFSIEKLGGQVRMDSISISYQDGIVYANSQDIHNEMDDFYNEGTYTKKTEIFLNDAALTDIATHFHGPVQQDRTTYYTTEDGKEALYMADLNGEISKINSGYSTVNESNIDAVRGKFSSVVEGNMAHFKYNKETEKAEYDYIVKTTDGIAGYYHALDEMFAQDYFGDTAWIDNEDGTFEHTVTGANDAYLEFFLAFAAPCLKPSILTDSNYITVDGMKLVIGTGKNDLNNKEYLSLKMVLVEDETNKGLVDNTEMVLSEARIYAGNDMFNESVMSEEVAHIKINEALNEIKIDEEVSDTLELPTTGKNNAVISWSSNSDAIVISNNEVIVNQKNEDVIVTLTATATINGVSSSKDYEVLVKSNATKEVEFVLGANGSASHNDGTSKTTYSETVDGYTLSITSGSSMYTGARDAKGNSCIKFGTGSKTGSMKFTVPTDVNKVIIYVAQYKTNTTKVTVNGKTYTITTASNNGAYTAIEIDTSSTKTVTFATASGGIRCMVNTIVFIA